MQNFQTVTSRSGEARIRRSIGVFLLILFVFYCAAFPANVFNLKVIIFLLLLIIGFPELIICCSKREFGIILIFIFCYLFITVTESLVIGNGSVKEVLSFSWVWLMLLIVPISIQWNVDYTRVFLNATLYIAIVLDLIFLLDITGAVNMFDNPLSRILYETNDLKLGKGELSTFGYFIFYKTTPLLVVSLSYFSYKKNIFLSLLLFVALCASGTRANLLIGVCVLLFGFCFNKCKNRLLVGGVLLISVILILYVCFYDDFMERSRMKAEISDNIKYSDIFDITNMMLNDKFKTIFGFGIGSYFNSTARGAVNIVEVSYFDYLRQVGIVCFMFFLMFLIFPVIKIIRKQIWWLLFGYLGYLLIAATNPLLVSSTSFLVYILVYIYSIGAVVK